jgi:hypothetical protein
MFHTVGCNMTDTDLFDLWFDEASIKKAENLVNTETVRSIRGAARVANSKDLSRML